MRRRDPRMPRSPVSLAISGAAVVLLCGCGGPILSLQPNAAEAGAKEPASTGSIARVPASFGEDLGIEDWRRAHAALGIALDPQGNGKPVKWENPETAMRGSVNPTGLPYVSDDDICRDFLASVVGPTSQRFLRGTGCKASGGEWTLRRLRPTKA